MKLFYFLLPLAISAVYSERAVAFGELTLGSAYSWRHKRLLPKLGFYVYEPIYGKLAYSSWSGFGGIGASDSDSDRVLGDVSWYATEQMLSIAFAKKANLSFGPALSYCPTAETPTVWAFKVKTSWKFP